MSSVVEAPSSDDDAIRELLRGAPWRPSEARRVAVREAIIASTATRPTRPRWRRAVIAAAAAAVALLVALAGRDPETRGLPIRVSPGATYEVLTVHTGEAADHVVRVHAGELSIDVGALPSYERLRIATADSELDGNGRFEVTAVADRIARVRVVTGTAALRVTGQRVVFLTTGDAWQAPVPTARTVATGIPARSSTADVPGGPDSVPPITATADAPGIPDSAPPITATADAPGSADSLLPIAATANAPGPPASRRPPGALAVPGHGVQPPGSAGATSPLSVKSSAPDGDAPGATSPLPVRPSEPDRHASGAAPPPVKSSEPARLAPAAANAAATSPSAASAASPSASSAASQLPEGADAAALEAITPEIAAAPPPGESTTVVERHFVAGWAALRGKRYAEAADEFRLAGEGSHPLASDAMFLRGTALLRGGRADDAERALVEFQARHPQSLRRGRAWLLLGSLRATRGDRLGAIQCFSAATTDRDATIAGAARKQLAALRDE